MGEPGCGDRDHRPGLDGIGGVDPGVGDRAARAARAARHEEDLGRAIAVEVLHRGELAGDLRQHLVPHPAAILALGVDVQGHRPALAGEHVGPAVAGEVEGVVGPRRREVRGGTLRRRHVQLVPLRVVGAEVVERARHDVEDAVAIEVAGAGPPRVVEVVEPLHAEPRRDGFDRHGLDVQVLERQVLESHVAGADIERDRSKAHPVLGGAGPEVEAAVQRRADDIGVDRHAQEVPFAGANAGRRRLEIGEARRQGDRRAAAAGAERRRRLRRIGMVRGQRAAQEGSHRAQRLTSRHPPTRIDRDAIDRQVAVLEREEDAGPSRRRVLHAEEHTSVAGRRTLEPREEVQVLVGPVEDEPAPSRPRLPRHLALVGRPGAVADDRPPAQSAAAEDRVRLEVAGRPLRVHHRREERRAEQDCRRECVAACVPSRPRSASSSQGSPRHRAVVSDGDGWSHRLRASSQSQRTIDYHAPAGESSECAGGLTAASRQTMTPARAQEGRLAMSDTDPALPGTARWSAQYPSLRDKRVLITGGGSGIGEFIVEAFVGAGRAGGLHRDPDGAVTGPGLAPRGPAAPPPFHPPGPDRHRGHPGGDRRPVGRLGRRRHPDQQRGQRRPPCHRRGHPRILGRSTRRQPAPLLLLCPVGAARR